MDSAPERTQRSRNSFSDCTCVHARTPSSVDRTDTQEVMLGSGFSLVCGFCPSHTPRCLNPRPFAPLLNSNTTRDLLFAYSYTPSKFTACFCGSWRPWGTLPDFTSFLAPFTPAATAPRQPRRTSFSVPLRSNCTSSPPPAVLRHQLALGLPLFARACLG